MKGLQQEVFVFFHPEVQQLLRQLSPDGIEEIRLRVGRPLVVHTADRLYTYRNFIPSMEQIQEILQKMSGHSYYAFVDEICKGFFTVPGGHRVGVAGTPVLEGGRIINMKHITSLNVRIAREVKDCALPLLPYLPANLLILSPPGFGKTTVLRDLARLAGGSLKVGLIDERGEVCAAANGEPQFDIGKMTDTLHLCPKSIGAEILLRGASPQIIMMDELSSQDIPTVRSIFSAGVKVVATAHGDHAADTLRRLEMSHCFDYAVILGRHRIKEVISL